MTPREPKVIDMGICAEHDQRCAVLPGESAVMQMDGWIFHPSWEAQSQGWHLIRAKTRLQKYVLRKLFGVRP